MLHSVAPGLFLRGLYIPSAYTIFCKHHFIVFSIQAHHIRIYYSLLRPPLRTFPSSNTMANSRVVFTISSILLALIIFNGIFSVLGRPLRTENKEQATIYKNSVMWHRHILGSEVATALKSQNPHEIEKWINDFRPTDPGHSPGAGHSSPHSIDSNWAPRP